MPLPKPALDNRDFDQLVAESRRQIPRLAPQWTDHNASERGITLIELAAWLTEQNIYRFDRPSDEARRAFARLVGIRPRPPGVARTVVAISDPNGVGAALAARTQLGAAAVALFETTDALYVSPATLATPMSGLAFGARPRAGSALYLGFDRALDAPGRTLSLYFWTDTWQRDAATREALVEEYEAALERLLRECPCEAWKAPAETLHWRHHYRVRTVWEYYAGGGVWVALKDVVDETRALSLSGFVRFTAPTGHQAGGGTGPYFYLRCRITAGRFECPPSLAAVAFNAVTAEHALSQPEKQLENKSRGHASAIFSFSVRPVVAGRTRLRLQQGTDTQTDWRAVPDWDRSGAHDRDFLVTPERGELQSGDGLRGAVLPAGYTVYVTFQEGGGDAGNLAAKKLQQVIGQQLDVWQPFAASGGTARETLQSVEARAYRSAARVDKAVTATDFERLALETPGVPIARAHAVAGLYPALPCYPAPGAVTLIVVPNCPLPAPLPSRALLDAVVRHLMPRRLVTSELHAVAPVYRRVTVCATLQLACNATAGDVRDAAIAAINAFFDPLSGGPDRNGWPLGRTVYRSEVLALLADLDGVARVTDFGLQGPGDSGPRCGNIDLCAHELVVPGRHKLQLSAYLPGDLMRSDPHDCKPC